MEPSETDIESTYDVDESEPLDQVLDRLSGEVESAAECVSALKRNGLRIAFENDPDDGRLDIQVLEDSGRIVGRLTAVELVELVRRDETEIEAWAALLHHHGDAENL
jgi:hypothetical protein